MTKTPEELTEDWKAGKLVQGWYFCELKNGLIHHFEFYGNDFTDLTCHIFPVAKVLAPVPTYKEFKAMQAELAEFKRSITSYIGKPIDYDIACETINKLLDDKKKLKKELSEHRENCCCLENEKLQLDNNKLEEEISELLTDNKKMQDQIADASKTIEALEDEIAELKEENKQLEEDTGYGWHTAGIESDKNDKFRALLKECAEYIGEDIEFREDEDAMYCRDILTRINAALSGDKIQANPLDCNKTQESEEK